MLINKTKKSKLNNFGNFTAVRVTFRNRHKSDSSLTENYRRQKCILIRVAVVAVGFRSLESSAFQFDFMVAHLMG